MKVSLLQENLTKALQYINKAVNTHPNIPVLANVLLEADKGQLKLSATNLEIGISTWIGCTVGEAGSLTVSAKLLAEFVNSLKPGKVEIYENGNMLEVKSVDNVAQFSVIPADDFPKLPEAEGEEVMEIQALSLADAISQTAFAAGTDESRPVLTGVLLIAENKNLMMVGIDGFRLARKNIALEKVIKQENFKEIVPAKSLMEVEKLIRDVNQEKETIKVYYLGNKNQMLFKIGEVEFSTRLIEGEFPDYEKIMPKEKTLRFVVNRNDLNDILKIVSIFARNIIGNKARFNLDAGGNKLKLAASVVDIGKNESVIPVEDLQGDDFETGFNVRYLIDMINAIKTDKIIFESNGPTAPGVFLDPEDKEYVHVIMPMRLD